MTSERFTELLNGPLAGPLPFMSLTRLALALWCVVEATGELGEEALEKYCHERQVRDEGGEL